MKSLIMLLSFTLAYSLTASAASVECSIATRPSSYGCTNSNPFEECKSEFSKPIKLLVSENQGWQETITTGFKFQINFMNDGYKLPTIKIYVWDEKSFSFRADEALNEALYQLNVVSGKNNFTTHGFTGLVYVYHPTTKAEMQYWCIQK